MNTPTPGTKVRIRAAESTLVGRIGYVVIEQEEKFFYRPESNFFVGTIEFFSDFGPVIDLQWDSKRGILVDSVEELEGLV